MPPFHGRSARKESMRNAIKKTALRGSRPSGRLPHCKTSGPADGFNQHRTDLIRVHVRGRTAVFEVSKALVRGGHRDAHRRAAVADAVAEGVNRRRLVEARQALL